MGSSIRELHPHLRPYVGLLLREAQRLRLRPRLTSTFRSFHEQRILYDKYRRGKHAYPVAPPGLSAHNYGLAFDLVSDDNAYLGRLWQSWNGLYGGSRDRVHFSPKIIWSDRP